MKRKILIKKFLLLVMIMITNITFTTASQVEITKNKKINKTKTVLENNSKMDISYYSENEIRTELKKAGVNSKSIEAFIIANNNSIKKNIDIEQVKKEFLKAIELDNKNYLALDAIGRIIVLYSKDNSKNSYFEAIKYFEKALKINPKFENAYKHLIWMYYNLSIDEEDNKKLNDSLEKRKAFSEQLIKLFPEKPEGYDSLYGYYSDKEDYDKAMTIIKKAIELYFKTKAKYYYYELGDDIHSSEYEYTNEHSGNILEFHLLEIYMDKGDDKKTFDYFFKLYEKKRKKPDTYSGLKSDFAARIKDLNEKYKNKDKKLYQENLKRFKALGIKLDND